MPESTYPAAVGPILENALVAREPGATIQDAPLMPQGERMRPAAFLIFERELVRLGNNLRTLRESRHLTQGALADKCGLHRSYVCDVERGVRNASVVSLLKLARGLQTSPDRLFLGFGGRVSD